MLPTTIGPLFTPMPISSSGRPLARQVFFSESSFSSIFTAARQALNA